MLNKLAQLAPFLSVISKLQRYVIFQEKKIQFIIVNNSEYLQQKPSQLSMKAKK